MQKTFQKSLLLTTALTAVIAVSSAGAQAADLTISAPGTFASAGNATSADIANAAAGDNVILDNANLSIIEDTNTDDGSANGTIDVGTITGTGDVLITTNNAGGGAGEDTVTVINSINTTGNVSLDTLDGDDAAITATITNGMTITGNLTLDNVEADSGDDIALTIGGAVSVGGNTNINAGDVAPGATSTLTLNGATNVFTGTTTALGGTNAADEAVIVLGGASANFAGGLTLTNGAAGLALLEVNGAAAQVIDGAISGTGDISVANTSGSTTTFNGVVNIAAITVNADGNAQNAVFTNNVTTSGAITLGDNNLADAITLTVGGSGTTTIAATGGIVDGGSEDTTLAVVGGSTVTMNSAVNVDQLTVTANSTFDANSTVATNNGITIAAGSTMDVGNGAVTSDVTNSGDYNISGSGNTTGNITNNSGAFVLFDTGSTGIIIGDITGTGTITSDSNNGEVQGNVTQSAGEISNSLTVSGNYVVTNTTFDETTGTLNIGANGDITGNLSAQDAGDGNLVVENAAGDTTLTGNVGSANAALNTVTIGGNTGTATLTVTGGYWVGTTDIGASDDLAFQSTTQTVAGTLRGAGDDEGRVVIGDDTNAATINFSGALGTGARTLNTVLINDEAILNVAADATGDITNLTVDGTMNLAQNAVLNVNTLAGTTGTVDLTIGTDTNATDNSANIVSGTQLTADTNAETVAGLTTTLTAGTGTIADGSQFLVYTSTGTVLGVANAETDTVAVTDTSALFDFVLVRGDNSNITAGNDAQLYALASQNSVASVSSDTSVQNALTAITGITGATDELATVINTVQNATAAQIDDVVESITSTVDGGNVVGAVTVSNEAANLVNMELASLRSEGVAAGDHPNGLRAWGQVFGQTAEQDARDNVAGFDLDSYGFTAGVDSQGLIEDGVLGMAFTYADTDVDSNNSNNTQTEIDTYQLTVYGNKMLDSATYVAGQVAYAFSQNDTTRSNVGGAGTAKGEFDSHQFNLRGEVGRGYEVAANTTLTPKASLNYLYYSSEDYTETGVGNAGLNVDNEDLSILELGVGADLGWEVDMRNGAMLKPVISAGVRYDVLGEEVQSTNSFIGGGASFKNEGFDPAQTTFDLGFSVTYEGYNDWDVVAEYDYEVKEDFDAHSAALKAVYNF